MKSNEDIHNCPNEVEGTVLTMLNVTSLIGIASVQEINIFYARHDKMELQISFVGY